MQIDGYRLRPAQELPPTKVWFQEREMDGDTVAEFQRRRRRAGRLSMPWMLLSVLGLAVAQWLAKDKDWYDIAMIAFAGCGFAGGLIGVSIFRCPNCDTVPYDEDGLPLNPARCSKCGARLR